MSKSLPQFDSVEDGAWWSNARRKGKAETEMQPRTTVRRGLIGKVVIRVRRMLRHSPRLRRATLLTIVGGFVVFGTVWSVGVIYLNNVIIKRSAELGRLDKERRILRTQNAILSAQAAKLSAPTRIVKIATKRLGMVHSEDMAKFIYLEPTNRPAAPRRVTPARTTAAPAAVQPAPSRTAGQASPPPPATSTQPGVTQ